jgi:lactate racemase
VQNDAFDVATQARVGVSSFGHEIWLNQEMLECDFKVLTGFIEPHFFAGFSGGGKAIMPGMAGQRTVLGNHDAGMISHPKATWASTSGNPLLQEITEVARAAGSLFLLNVALNRGHEITGVFAGELEQAHAAGCAFVKETSMVPVDRPFDIVITTNSGYPLDQNLYQAVKGMAAAALVVKEGGAIIVAAECSDGLPEHGLYGELLRGASSPAELLATVCQPGFLKQDQWQAQIQAQIQMRADVYVRTDGMSREGVEAALIKYSRRIEDTLAELLGRYGHDASICVLPEGPQTIPYLAG